MMDYIGLCMLILLLATVSEVIGGKVSIDLNLLSMIKVQKDLDLCNVLTSDIIQGDLSCPLAAGDLVLEALGTDDDTTTTQCADHVYQNSVYSQGNSQVAFGWSYPN